MSAPSAAVAVQPYQYIAGRKLPIDGPDGVSRMMRAQKHDAERGIDGEQREIELERDHVEDRERRSRRQMRTGETTATDVIARSP